MAPVYFLEAIAAENPATRFFQASSAEMFGAAEATPQSETTPFHPRNPYGISKVFAHSMVGGYRAQHKLFAACGILFTHESPRRPEQFVTRKITSSLAKIKLGLLDSFELGNLDSARDWGFAGDYAEAMWRMLQADTPDDYVIATGEAHTVREFVQYAAKELGVSITFEGTGADEIGRNEDGKAIITINREFIRPGEAVVRCGDASKLRSATGWKPKDSFGSLVSRMAQADLHLNAR